MAGSTRQHGYWQWIGDPIMPRGLVELIESRIGALPAAVGAVIDALAVGEPIELAALRRITDPDAVEEADTRGLISLDHIDSGIEVRVAHPLYGEVRRKRAAPTRLRRLRGLVATELAAGDDRDDIRVVVRRAALSLDSDLAPDADLLIRAAQGAIWLADLPLADRLAEAAVRAGAGPEAQFIRAHALSWLGRGQEAEAVLADVPITRLTDQDHARFTYLRASNMLWALADPARAKEIIDDASRITPRAGSQLYRRPPHGVLVRDGPPGCGDASRRKTSRWTTCPPSSARRQPGRWLPSPRTRGAPPKPWPSPTRDTPSRPAVSTLRT